ncbi:MAG: hypothetical protein IKK57_12035 [Clostridia bacterium]|nr:hypothetical protein [Clostridia bacterium]
MKSLKRLALCLLAVLMLLTMLLASAEQETQLQLTFIGMYATSDGGYQARSLKGAFDVYYNGRIIGTVTSDENGSEPMPVSVSGNVQLIPVQDTMPEGISVNAQGYTVSIVQGRLNLAPIVVYAQAGLFRVHTESRAEFELISEVGDTVLRFATDSKGDYALPVAITAGQYTLRMTGSTAAISPWRDKIINVLPYTGPDSIALIDASYYYTPQITLRPATPTPAVTPKPVATATPAPATPTVKPTDSLSSDGLEQPTATPTPTPTATPVPTHGTLVLQGMGDLGAAASYSVTAGGVTYGAGELITGENASVTGLKKGNYIITIDLPENVLLTGLNGYPSVQRTIAQWLVTISNGKTSTYRVELSNAASLYGEVPGQTMAQVTISGSEIHTTEGEGAYSFTGLAPDTYTVTCVLPEGRYVGEGWSFVDMAGHTLAICKAELSGGEALTLPAISEKELGGVSGVICDESGAPLSDISVSLTDHDGLVLATAVSGADGMWHISDVENGSYTLQYYSSRGGMIPDQYVVLTDEENHPQVMASQIIPAYIRVSVFNDENNSGVLNTYETFVPGALISLLRYEKGQEILVACIMTDDSGEAILSAPAGEYILRCELPEDFGYANKGREATIMQSGMELSAERVQEATVVLTQGETLPFGIGAMQTCTLSGTYWHDLNADGIWQDDEPGIPGILVTADGARNGLHYETLTDENGYFEIRQIRNGTYNVCYNVPEGYVFTFRANGPAQYRSLMTVEAERVGKDQIILERGDVLDEQNIGLVTECVVEGVCFLDENYNGVFDEGERILPGVQIELFRQSNSKRLRTGVSDENGVYRFGNLRGDTFKIKVLLPTGYTFTVNVPGNPQANQIPPRDGKREQTVLNIDVENASTKTIMVGAICYGSISGVVYYDANCTGEWETGEKNAQGIVVTLLDEEGNAVKSAKTNRNGAYTFGDLPPGDYCVSVSPAKGYAFTFPGEGSIITTESDGIGYSDAITLPMGDSVTGMDAGMIVPAKISGTVFADANDNGRKDASEAGLVGAYVSLMNEDGVVEVQQVEENGAYTFSPVKPGRYQLQYELPEDAVFANVTDGGNRITAEGVTGTGNWFEVEAGDYITAPFCGGLYLSTITGYAYADSDGSGMMDASEQTMAALTMILIPERPELEEIRMVTGADGQFAFVDLRPGAYVLTVTCPEGYVMSQLTDVTLPVAHGVNTQSGSLQIGMGDAWLEQALGCVKPSAYTGYAWLDENLNGLRDAQERAAAGETVMLLEQRSGSVVAELTTAEDGSFRAEGLAPGMYTIACQLVPGMMGTSYGDSTFTEADGRLTMTDIAIAEGTENDGALLGLVRETTLSGHVWLDDSGKTMMVSGAKVRLLMDGEVIAEETTADDGLYTFGGLMPGAYTIDVQFPSGYLALEPGDRRISDGSLVSILAQNDGNYGVSSVIDLRMAVDRVQMDMGSVKPGRLGDLCWLDLNGNGLQEKGEGGIPGVIITLTRNGSTVATTTSDQYGYYVFEKLYPGEYTLVVDAPAEVVPTQRRTDFPGIVSVLEENGVSVLVPVKSSGANYAADLGFVLVKEGKYPAGYGEGATQNWTKIE